MLYASCVKLFAEVLELFTHAMFQLAICKMALSECSFQGPKMMEVGGGGAKSGL